MELTLEEAEGYINWAQCMADKTSLLNNYYVVGMQSVLDRYEVLIDKHNKSGFRVNTICKNCRARVMLRDKKILTYFHPSTFTIEEPDSPWLTHVSDVLCKKCRRNNGEDVDDDEDDRPVIFKI